VGLSSVARISAIVEVSCLSRCQRSFRTTLPAELSIRHESISADANLIPLPSTTASCFTISWLRCSESISHGRRWRPSLMRGRVVIVITAPPISTETALQSPLLADFSNVMTCGADITASSTRAVVALGHLRARSARVAKGSGFVWVLAADALVRAPECKAISNFVLAFLRDARSTTPITWHYLVGCIMFAELVEMLIMHVLPPFFKGAQDDILGLTIPVLMPTEGAPANFVGGNERRQRHI